MSFSREGLLSHFGQSFNDSVRASLPTIAEPAWFAPPIDVRQDDGSLTIFFQVAGNTASELRVEVSGRNLFVWGPRLRRAPDDAPRRAMRVFALPFDAAPHELHTSRSGDLLQVRIAKKVDRVSSDRTADAA